MRPLFYLSSTKNISPLKKNKTVMNLFFKKNAFLVMECVQMKLWTIERLLYSSHPLVMGKLELKLHSRLKASYNQAKNLGHTTYWLIQMIARCASRLTFSTTNYSSIINASMLINFVERLHFTLNDVKHLVLFMSKTSRNWYYLNAYMSKTCNKMKHNTLEQT